MPNNARWSRRHLLKAGAIASVPLATGIGGCSIFSKPTAGSKAAALQAKIGGTVVVKSDAAYEAWRKAMIWQLAKADRKPDMIVQATSTADVQEAVRYAAKNGMKATTRCGGHSMAACFLRDTGMLIDIGHLDGVEVDKATKTAKVGPGVFSRGLSERLLEDGLAFPGAHCGTVPISGYLLGGGVGLNANEWTHGLSVFGVKGIDIVTPDGEMRHASETENPDLFWAARGGGPGLFGVVTQFHLQCFDAPGVIWGDTYVLPYTALSAVTDFMRDTVPTLDRSVEVLYAVAAIPDKSKDLPAEERFQIFLDVNAFAKDEAEGRRKVAAITNHPVTSLAVDAIRDRAGSYDRYYSDNEAGFPQAHWMGDSIWVDDPTEAMRIIGEALPDCPAPRAAPLVLYTGEQDQPDAAASRYAPYYIACYFEWDEEADEAPSRAFSRELFKKLKPIARGSYINEMDQEGRPEDVPDCYSPEAWARLAQLRKQWDPTGVFHDFYGQA
ncbi:FAD-binding oxidoreductase [Croceicoccus sediminis]|uniref:FAD-binding oxidoreductase n=1 Tax=Croceicoccus sediminis TaxID=2571150 RepID=UPI001182F2B6|nr:FAD-binding oxidoreductase [Croceicoccus sediminis]